MKELKVRTLGRRTASITYGMRCPWEENRLLFAKLKLDTVVSEFEKVYQKRKLSTNLIKSEEKKSSVSEG